jgi:hypothetical protein
MLGDDLIRANEYSGAAKLMPNVERLSVEANAGATENTNHMRGMTEKHKKNIR